MFTNGHSNVMLPILIAPTPSSILIPLHQCTRDPQKQRFVTQTTAKAKCTLIHIRSYYPNHQTTDQQGVAKTLKPHDQVPHQMTQERGKRGMV